jgi:hypothetical protein
MCPSLNSDMEKYSFYSLAFAPLQKSHIFGEILFTVAGFGAKVERIITCAYNNCVSQSSKHYEFEQNIAKRSSAYFLQMFMIRVEKIVTF